MSTDHIEAVLENVSDIVPQFKRAFRLELEFRSIREEI
jgi:hypothetical protein